MFHAIPSALYLWLAVVLFAASNSIVRILIDLGAQHAIDGRNAITFCNLLCSGNMCAVVALFLTGEISDVYHAAKDVTINVIFAGHHATETLGVKTLSELVRKKFKVETVFIDIPTGL